MPTGYTAEVGDGKVTEFRKFAMRCARAFGPLVSMRDDSWDAPIPDKIEPDSHYRNRVAEIEQDIKSLKVMSFEEIKRRCEKSNNETLAQWEAMKLDRAKTKTNYEAMLAKVEAWTPPTKDHHEMKKFMIQQLTDSIKWDCGDLEPYKPKIISDPAEWFENQMKSKREDLEYYQEYLKKEEIRTKFSTEWIQALKKSL